MSPKTENSQNNSLPGSKKEQISPQSSLGQVGKALLRFFTPALKNTAHSTPQSGKENAVILNEKSRSTVSKPDADLSSETAEQTQAKVTPISAAPGSTGSGVIKVTRDPSTPWVNVVINVMGTLETAQNTARSAKGNSAYQSARDNQADVRRRTVGKMVDLVTHDDELDNIVELVNGKVLKEPEKEDSVEKKAITTKDHIDAMAKGRRAA